MKNRKVFSKRKNGHNNGGGGFASNGLFKVTIKNDEQAPPDEPNERVFEPEKEELIPVKTTPRIIKTTMKSRPVVETNQLLDYAPEPPVGRRVSSPPREALKEASKAAAKLDARTSGEFQFTNEHLEELEEFNLPRDALEIAKLARFGRDREGKNILSVLLEWKNIKAFVKDFTKNEFAPISRCITLLVAAGADPMVADRQGKCVGHYLAEWRFTKEKSGEEKETLELPHRALELMEELGYMELQCHKPTPGRKMQPSLLYPRDEDKNNFLHVLIKHNYKRKPQYKVENLILFRAMQIMLVNMRIPNIIWAMYGRDRTDLKSLFQQPGLFMEQNFNRIRMKTQSQEIDEYFKKIPRGFVIKFKKRKAAPAPEKRRSPTPPQPPKSHRRESARSPPVKRSVKSPVRSPEKKRTLTPPPPKVKSPSPSPPPKKREKHRSPTPKKRSPSPVRRPEKKEKRKRREPTPPPPPSRVTRQRTPPKRRTRSSDEEDNYTDNENEEDDTLDVGVNIISADDFIDDALSLIPKDIKPTKKTRRRSSSSSSSSDGASEGDDVIEHVTKETINKALCERSSDEIKPRIKTTDYRQSNHRKSSRSPPRRHRQRRSRSRSAGRSRQRHRDHNRSHHHHHHSPPPPQQSKSHRERHSPVRSPVRRSVKSPVRSDSWRVKSPPSHRRRSRSPQQQQQRSSQPIVRDQRREQRDDSPVILDQRDWSRPSQRNSPSPPPPPSSRRHRSPTPPSSRERHQHHHHQRRDERSGRTFGSSSSRSNRSPSPSDRKRNSSRSNGASSKLMRLANY